MSEVVSKVPELRFLEFSGAWEEKVFGDVFNRVTKKNKENNGNVLTISAQRGLINQKDYFTKSVSAKDVTGYYLLHKDDFAYNKSYSKGYPLGAIKRLKKYDKGVVSTLYICFKAGEDNVSFLEQFFESGGLNKEVHKIAQEGARNHGLLNMSVVEFFDDIKLNLPTKPEQTKIAAFLAAVDTKIEQLSKKKELLGEYKKGLMQKVFSQEIRFKADDGSAFPDWKEKKYDDIYRFLITNSLSRDKLNYDLGEVKNIHYGDIHTKFKTLFDVDTETVPFINDDVDISRIDVDNYCQVGDIAIADASEDYDDIGKTIEIVNLNSKKILAGLHTFLARPVGNDTCIGFMGSLLKSWKVRKQVMTIAQGAKVLGISKTNLSKIEFNLPSKPEQQKIATFLTAFDTKIEQVSKQLDESKQFKKALLQQMFV